MNKYFKRTRAYTLSTIIVAIAALSGATVNAQTTTLGTRGKTSQPNPAITANATGQWKDYDRAADYPRTYSYPIQFITTKSGLKLAVNVTVPASANGRPATGKFPAILTQTAYRADVGQILGSTVLPLGNTLAAGGRDNFMVTRGYVSVSVDAVGTGMSDGESQLLGGDEQQGYAESVEWITKQPWSNGDIGAAGTSYLGITAMQTAAQSNPAIKALFAVVPMGDAYRGVVGTGGMLNAEFISIWLPLTQLMTTLNQFEIALNPDIATQVEAANKQHIDAIDNWYLPIINKALAGETGYATDDGNFWSVRSVLERTEGIKAPTFIIGGTNDIFQRDEPLLYERLKRNVDSKLLIVPGAHVQAVLASMFNAHTAAADGAPSSHTLLLQWFDQYLKGMNTGAKTLPNVTQYVQGYGKFGVKRYASATDWPHPQMSPQRWYLHGDMSLSQRAPFLPEKTHTMTEPAGASVMAGKTKSGTNLTAKITFRDHSQCSVSSVQWSLGLTGLLPLPCHTNNAYVEKMQGALTYETKPLSSDLYLNGPMQADIWMTSTRTQAGLSVRIDDVDAFGVATPISNGLLSATYRAVDNSRSRYVNGAMIQPWHAFTVASRLPVQPGQPMLMPVEIFPNAALIRKGHKLRVAISASNQVQGVWPANFQPLADGGVSTILNSRLYPSSVVLPVVPSNSLTP